MIVRGFAPTSFPLSFASSWSLLADGQMKRSTGSLYVLGADWSMCYLARVDIACLVQGAFIRHVGKTFTFRVREISSQSLFFFFFSTDLCKQPLLGKCSLLLSVL